MSKSVLLLKAALFAIVSQWSPPAPPPGPFDEATETPAEYELRVETIVDGAVVASVTPTTMWSWGRVVSAAGVIEVWHAESRFDFWIHAGLVHPDPAKHQDHGVARCMGSLHPSPLVPDWEQVAGTSLEATTRCARATLRVLRSAAWICARAMPPTEEAFARTLELYATGHSCEPSPESRRRAHRWMNLASKIGRSS